MDGSHKSIDICLEYSIVKNMHVHYVWRHQRAVTRVWHHYDYDRGSFAEIPQPGRYQAIILTNGGILLIRN